MMVPMVESEEQARQIVQFAKYPPNGRRGAAFGVAHDDYVDGDVSAKMRELKERVQRKRDERDAKDAEKAAERAEEYASDSLDFAAWAIAEAEMDVLDAVDARVIANAKAAGSPST